MSQARDRTTERARPLRAPIETPTTARTKSGSSGQSRPLFRVIPIVPGKGYVRAPRSPGPEATQSVKPGDF